MVSRLLYAGFLGACVIPASIERTAPRSELAERTREQLLTLLHHI